MDDFGPIELTVREPTGLELGTFDIFLIRQKIYVGELPPRCEFRDADGSWRPLSEHGAFSELMWLLGIDSNKQTGKRVSRFGGWHATGKDSSGRVASQVRIQKTEEPQEAKGGLFGRLLGKK